MKRYTHFLSLAEHRHNARTHTHTDTLPFGSIASRCHGNSQSSSLGLRLRMRAGAKRPLLINGNSQPSCGHLAPKQSSSIPTCPAPFEFFTFPCIVPSPFLDCVATHNQHEPQSATCRLDFTVQQLFS